MPITVTRLTPLFAARIDDPRRSGDGPGDAVVAHDFSLSRDQIRPGFF